MPVGDDALVERLADAGRRSIAVGEVVGERRADQLLPLVARHPRHLLVDVGDGALRIDRDQAVDRGLDQPAVVAFRFAELLLELLLLGDVARRGEHALQLAAGIPERRGVVRDHRHPARPRQRRQLVVGDAAFAQHLLDALVGARRLGEVGLERRPDQLLARVAGERLHLLVDVGDDAERVGGHQRVDVRFDQRARVELRRPQFFSQADFVGDVLRDQQEPDRSSAGVPSWCGDHARREPLAVLADPLDGAFPFAVAQRHLHDLGGRAGLDVLGCVQDRRERPSDDLFGLVSVEPSRAFVPQQDLAVEIFADHRVFGGRLEDVADEIDRLLRVTDDRAVEELCLPQFLGEAQLSRHILRDQQQADGLAVGAAPRRHDDARGDAASVLADAADDAFPFAVAERGFHHRAGRARGDVFRRVQDLRLHLADDFVRLVAVHAPRAFVPEQNRAVEALADDRVFGRGLEHVGEEVHRIAGLTHDRGIKEAS
jgi:hypothetical protein